MLRIDVLLEGYAFQTDVGIIGFCSVILIEGGPRRVLVDTAHVGRRIFIGPALERRGLTPADIDCVVMTHAHWDHIQNWDLFPHAPLLMHRHEWLYSQHPHPNDWATPLWTGDSLRQARVVEVEEGYEVMPGCRIIELIGHSPGSIGVEVETEQGLCIITGDALHFASVALSGENPLVFWDDRLARQSIQRVVQRADVIYPGHDQPFRLVNGRIEYLHPFDITLTGLAADRPGLKFLPEPPPRGWRVMPGIEEQRARLEGLLRQRG
jgi:N-acyl homoserine lactone hydrolase